MPHAWIEYSANLADESEIKSFGECVYNAMVETGIFPVAGIRVRILQIDQSLVGDKDPRNGFVHLQLCVGEGRKNEVLTTASDLLFERTSLHLKPLANRARLAYAMILQEIPGAYSYKMNNLHKHLTHD
ncbi:hypothetical protein [uncultured Aliiroseovarius sp.]|uniref:hypothetical protein n=1 Tax=uncultured Aliiroseovarius sp. TaxID=1658783 RepID=UPI002596807B|nr:hypothetical protein [uncultured Aliiroseovarius sp.]